MKSWLIPMVLLAACNDNFDDTFGLSRIQDGGLGVQPGIIKFYDDPILIGVPETAFVGDSVTIGVKTYGGGCVVQGETRLNQSGLSVEVLPFDGVIDPGPQGACPDVLLTFDHDVVVVFDGPGTANVVIRGREWPANEEFSREYQIAVQ